MSSELHMGGCGYSPNTAHMTRDTSLNDSTAWPVEERGRRVQGEGRRVQGEGRRVQGEGRRVQGEGEEEGHQ